MNSLIVTLDGPGGTGKSTVSRALAKRAGLPHLDTGAYYRAATLAVIRAGIDPGDEQSVVDLVSGCSLDQRDGVMYLNGEDVSAPIRGDYVTAAVSEISAHPRLREHLVQIQRDWMRGRGFRGVVEGRDIGSVVFPDAEVKVFLDASPKVRAQRRAAETGEDPDEVLADLTRRDAYDSTRVASPLKVPDGALVIDTSTLSLDEVVDRLSDLVASKS